MNNMTAFGQSALYESQVWGNVLGMGMDRIGRGMHSLGRTAWNETKIWGSALGMGFECGADYWGERFKRVQIYLIEVGNVMVEEYPYTLNMQNICGITSNVAGTGATAISAIPKGIGYSHSHFLQGGRLAYRWANQYSAGTKLVTVSQVGAMSGTLGIISAGLTGYTIGATIRSYCVGWQRYSEKYR